MYIKAEISLHHPVIFQQQEELQQTQDRNTIHSKDTGINTLLSKPCKLQYALFGQIKNTITPSNLNTQKLEHHNKEKSYKNNNLYVYIVFLQHCIQLKLKKCTQKIHLHLFRRSALRLPPYQETDNVFKTLCSHPHLNNKRRRLAGKSSS